MAFVIARRLGTWGPPNRALVCGQPGGLVVCEKTWRDGDLPRASRCREGGSPLKVEYSTVQVVQVVVGL